MELRESGPSTFSTLLLAWSEDSRRDLPWRRTRDPWSVLVSELMLQQTQVDRVVPRYQAFLAEFPTASACASAPVSAIVRAWTGLGYNRRAVHLHEAAKRIRGHHSGSVPADLDALLDLPGVGPYTARAVLVFAFEQHHGVVDTNAARVLARAVAGARLTPSEAQELADGQVPEGRSWAYNQAILDLGALHCGKRLPACGTCPVVRECTWAVAGFPQPDPAEGSAGTSGRQSPFEGSDRQGRGRLVNALRDGPLRVTAIPDLAGWPTDPERAMRVADSLVADGLADYDAECLVLPE